MLKFLFHYTLLCYIIHKPLQQLLSLNHVPIQYAVKIVWNLDIIFEDLNAKLEMFCDFASNILRIFRVLERREETNSKSFLVTF